MNFWSSTRHITLFQLFENLILRLAELLDGEPVQQQKGDYTGNLKYGIKRINITYDVKGAIQSVELWTDDLYCKYENSTGEYAVNKI